MSLGRAVIAVVAAFGLTACVFDLSGEDKPAPKPRTAEENLPPRDEANWARMQAFLEANKQKEGVKVLENGIQYRVLTAGPGKGRRATWANTVVVRYKGMLTDGTVFDETKPEAPPAELELGGVIQGWQDVVPLMRNGDKWEVVIPSDLAYGRKGRGKIQPDQVLVFEIELVDVK
jgi:FKBP-type peptidyl-prolyl cis-trans isomerase